MLDYKAVIFDLDGTLLNTLQDIATATNNVLLRHDLPLHELATFPDFIGRGIPQLVYSALPDKIRNNDSMLRRLVAEVMAEYTKCLDKYTAPYPGISQLLTSLNDLGILLAVLSNKAHQFMYDIINKHFPDNQFEVIFGARPGIMPKPDPYAALEIAEIMHLLPEQVIFVGDSTLDMLTAQNSGMLAIGVGWGFCPADELIRSGAKKIIYNPFELMTYFKTSDER